MAYPIRRLAWRAAIASLLMAVTAPAAADSFAQCMSALADQARRAEIPYHAIEAVLGSARLSERVLEQDAAQPEFTRTFAGYYPTRVSDRRVARGRELLREHQALLQRIQQDTGVPPHYILSFWGLETNYGSYLGDHSVPSALATLACDGRRAEYFSNELLNAMRIVARGDVTVDAMLGSWAGAMGNVQFMPSAYLNHAVDADGDGKRDLWNSVPDALASAGRFLQSLGWQPGLRWGREVYLPEQFDYLLLGQERPLSFWANLGVRDTADRGLPALDLPASIIAPAGADGPIFIRYANFDTIMGWNRSEYYAITVGRLADRIAGAGRLHQPIPDQPTRMSLDDVRDLQTRLTQLGHDPGEVDGMLGPATREAIAAFQAASGIRPDGYPSSTTLERLADRAVLPAAKENDDA